MKTASTKSVSSAGSAKGRVSSPNPRSRSASERATRAVRKGKLLTADTPKERSPKQENL